jgi:hypothetical protein
MARKATKEVNVPDNKTVHDHRASVAEEEEGMGAGVQGYHTLFQLETRSHSVRQALVVAEYSIFLKRIRLHCTDYCLYQT